jgi:hypothetical protein
MRVNLKIWMKSNDKLLGAWIGIGLVTLWLIVKELRIYTLPLISPFLPLFIVAVIKMIKELKK